MRFAPPAIRPPRLPARYSSGTRTTQRTIGSTSPLLFRNDGLDAAALDSDAAPEAADLPRLSEREREVLTLIVKGFSYAEAARLTGVSPHTVTTHVRNIYRKLEVHSRGEAGTRRCSSGS